MKFLQKRKQEKKDNIVDISAAAYYIVTQNHDELGIGLLKLQLLTFLSEAYLLNCCSNFNGYDDDFIRPEGCFLHSEKLRKEIDPYLSCCHYIIKDKVIKENKHCYLDNNIKEKLIEFLDIFEKFSTFELHCLTVTYPAKELTKQEVKEWFKSTFDFIIENNEEEDKNERL